MEISNNKLIVTVRTSVEKLETWLVIDNGLSFWRPDYYKEFSEGVDSRLRERGDIHFDGVEIATDKDGALTEFGFMADVSSMQANTVVWPNKAIQGSCLVANLKKNEMINMDDDQENEDTLEYDHDDKIISWYCINKIPDRYVLIATNVAVGLKDNELTGLLAKVNKFKE